MKKSNIPCEACGYNPETKVLVSWKIKIPVEARSGNQIGSNSKGPSGWKYRAYKKLLGGKLNPLLGKHKVLRQGKKRRRIKLTRAYGKNKRAYDTDNLYWGFKPLVDILQEQSILVNDNQKWCSRPRPKQQRSETDKGYIVLEIEELDVEV